MTVYLVPVGHRRYHLYVEVPADDGAGAPGSEPGRGAAGPGPGGPRGWVSRQIHRFRATLAEAEQARLRRERGEPDHGSGLGHAILRRIAEAVAEQRLLWHLRHQTHALVRHPDDLDRPAALAEVRAEFSRDIAKHRRWMIIDGLTVAVTGPLFFFVPGPNVLSWYFTFRTIGHVLSWRGARKGLTEVEWHTEPSPALSEVRAALALPAHDRRLRLLAIGDALGLDHLAGFVERVSAN
jgi:hypothetical protein